MAETGFCKITHDPRKEIRVTHLLYDLLRSRAVPTEKFRHLVLFKPLPGTTDEQLDEIIEDFNALYPLTGGAEAGILIATVARNLDDRKGYTLVEYVEFRDVEAFLAWHAHPAHTEFATRMSKLMDVWVVGDMNF